MNKNKNIPTMFLKFGTKEHIESLQSGHIYMKNLQYYVNCEKETNDDTAGDMYEGHIMQKNIIAVLSEPYTQEHLATIKADTTALNIGYLRNPIFCLFTLDLRNYKESTIKEELKYSCTTFLLINSKKLYTAFTSQHVRYKIQRFWIRWRNTWFI